MVVGAAATHESDSPDFAGEVAESAADFNIIFVEQLGSDGSVVETGGELYSIEHGQTIVGGDDELESELFEAVAEQLMISAVALKANV